MILLLILAATSLDPAMAAMEPERVIQTADWISTAQAGKRIGLIGLDTSHAPAFARVFNDPDAPAEDLRGFRVVAAYPQGSRDIASSVSRVPEYVRQLRDMGIEIVDSIPALVERVDFVLLTSNDGRVHLEQARPVIAAGKPLYVDKPMAASLADVIALFEAARARKRRASRIAIPSCRSATGALVRREAVPALRTNLEKAAAAIQAPPPAVLVCLPIAGTGLLFGPGGPTPGRVQ